MKPAFFIAALFMALPLHCRGQVSPVPGGDDPQTFAISIYWFPPVFPGLRESGKLSYNEALTGRDDPKDFAAITRFFKGKGIDLPPGSEAFYMDFMGVLVVRSTEKARTAIGDYMQKEGYPYMDGLDSWRVGITAVECTLPAETNPLFPRHVTCEEIEKLPPGSVKVLDSVFGATVAGQRAEANHLFNPNPAAGVSLYNGIDSLDNLAPGESGSIMIFEPVPALVGKLFTIGLTYRLVIPANPRGGNHAVDLYLHTTFISGGDSPMILDIVPAPEGDGKFIVIIGRADMVHPWQGNPLVEIRRDSPFEYSNAINALPSP